MHFDFMHVSKKSENNSQYFNCDFRCISCIAYFVALLLFLYEYCCFVCLCGACLFCQFIRRVTKTLVVATPATPVAKASGTLAYFSSYYFLYMHVVAFTQKILQDRLLVFLCYARPVSSFPNIPKCLAPTCMTQQKQ